MRLTQETLFCWFESILLIFIIISRGKVFEDREEAES